MFGNWVFNRDMWIELFKIVVWLLYFWFLIMLGCLMLLRYVFWLFSVFEWDRFFGKWEENGVCYLMEEVKYVRWFLFEVDFVVLYILFMGYVVVVFVGSWWL